MKESENTCINILKTSKTGNVLIFLPGKSDINRFIVEM